MTYKLCRVRGGKGESELDNLLTFFKLFAYIYQNLPQIRARSNSTQHSIPMSCLRSTCSSLIRFSSNSHFPAKPFICPQVELRNCAKQSFSLLFTSLSLFHLSFETRTRAEDNSHQSEQEQETLKEAVDLSDSRESARRVKRRCENQLIKFHKCSRP